jgi:undecaprenyl-diphosphatase
MEMIFTYIQSVDTAIILTVEKYFSENVIVIAANVVTIAGYGAIAWIAILIPLTVRLRNPVFALYWSVVFIAVFLLFDLGLKNIVDRARPFVDMPFLSIHTILPTSYSFPSSHAALSGAAWFMITRVWRGARAYASVCALTVLVSLSRVVLKVHYPSDVICGYCLGLLTAWYVWKIIRGKDLILYNKSQVM